VKWIGQHIWDFISRFRSDVYLENLSATSETDILVVDSSGKVSTNSSAGGGASLTQEQVEDFAGSMIATGGTKTGISITYQDGTGDMDFEVDHDAATNFAADEHYTQANIVATGDLNSGAITSDFGDIDNGSNTLDTGAATVASLTCTAAGTFGGGYGSTGATISTAGVAQFNGAITTDSTLSATGGIVINGNASGGGYIRLHEDTDNGIHYVALRAPESIDTAFTLYLPDDDGDADEFLQTDGSGNLSWAAASGGGVTSDPYSVTQIKVMPSEFTMNDDYNRAPVLVEDDTTNILGIKAPSISTELYAWVKIPSGYKATHAQVYSDATTSSAVTIKSYNYQTGADNNISSSSGDLGSSIDITDIPASATQDLVIKVAPSSVTTLIYGALITIAAV